jgi:nucleoside-diphosphate kinase
MYLQDLNFKNRKESNKEIKYRTFAMIKPDCYLNIGKIINMIEEDGFTISNMKIARLTEQDAQQFYAEHKGKPFYNSLVEFISSDLVVGLELVADDCVAKWRRLLGPTSPAQAKKESPNSIRAKFGKEGVQNAAHGSDSPASAVR